MFKNIYCINCLGTFITSTFEMKSPVLCCYIFMFSIICVCLFKNIEDFIATQLRMHLKELFQMCQYLKAEFQISELIFCQAQSMLVIACTTRAICIKIAQRYFNYICSIVQIATLCLTFIRCIKFWNKEECTGASDEQQNLFL